MMDVTEFRGPSLKAVHWHQTHLHSTVPRQEASDELVHRILAIKPDQHGKYARDPFVTSLLAVASNWAYSNQETMALMMTRQGLANNTCAAISITNDAMFVESTAFFIRSQCGRLGLLCFRGTEPKNVINWLTDATVSCVGVAGLGQVHGGFHRNMRATWDLIAEALKAAVRGEVASNVRHVGPNGADGHGKEIANGHYETNPLEALYITGHSLGAAMAVLAAAFIYTDQDQDFGRVADVLRGVYTFGQPMVGDSEFARSCERVFKQPLYRFVYENDIVPRLPPFSTGPFQHFGAEFRSNKVGWLESSRVVQQVATASISIPIGVLAWTFNQLPILRHIRLPFSWNDHSPVYYVSTSNRSLNRASEFDVI